MLQVRCVFCYLLAPGLVEIALRPCRQRIPQRLEHRQRVIAFVDHDGVVAGRAVGDASGEARFALTAEAVDQNTRTFAITKGAQNALRCASRRRPTNSAAEATGTRRCLRSRNSL
jgi:hypothetical protein